MFNDFFRGKSVLVTGVAGVKGTWLALELLEAGSRVIGLDNRQPDARSNFVASGLDERITFVRADVADLNAVQRAAEGVECVFHLAAISLVGDARRRPWETYRSNVLGTVAVLEAMRLSPTLQYAVIVTTDKVYRPKNGEPWIESDPLVASEPYPISKACAELVTADYYQQYLRPAGKRVGIARAGNVVLGGDPYSSEATGGAGHLHVDCFEALMQGKQPEIFTPEFTRPYTYGLDILTGYMSLMSHLDDSGVDGEAFNFGPHERHGVENRLVATKICEIWNNGLRWRTTKTRSEPFARQSLSWEKAQQRLGWQPAYTVHETLEQVANWYRAWAAHAPVTPGSMAAANLSLIQAHRDAAARLGVAWSITGTQRPTPVPQNA